MINPITRIAETTLFDRLQCRASDLRKGVESIKNVGLEQKDLLLRTIAKQTKDGNAEFIEASKKMYEKLLSGASFSEAVSEVKPFLPNSAAIKETS